MTISLDDHRAISGQYGPSSYVATSPAAPAVYLERAYEVGDDGEVIVHDHGVYLDGTRIVAVKIGAS